MQAGGPSAGSTSTGSAQLLSSAQTHLIITVAESMSNLDPMMQLHWPEVSLVKHSIQPLCHLTKAAAACTNSIPKVMVNKSKSLAEAEDMVALKPQGSGHVEPEARSKSPALHWEASLTCQ
jgi:hypothetical protein